MYYVKTRNWNNKKYVADILNFIAKLTRCPIDKNECDNDHKYYNETTNFFQAYITFVLFFIISPLSGGWTYSQITNHQTSAMSLKGRKGFEMKQYLDKFGREITEIGKMKYQLKSLNESSAKFGACEICNKHVSEVFLQAKLEEYKPGSYMDKGTQFGHKQCLLNQRIGE